MSHLSQFATVQLGLYVLAIVLGTYAVWERFPRDYAMLKRLAFALALLTLFLTFSQTAVKIEEIEKDLHVLVADSRLKRLAEKQDLPSTVAFELAGEAIERLADLCDGQKKELNEWEAFEFLTGLMKKEAESHPKDLEVIAVSLDLAEFDEDAPACVCDYEKVLFDIALHGRGHVEVTYVLDQSQWQALQLRKGWLSSEGQDKPWLVPDTLNELGLNVIARHQDNRLVCYVVPPEAVPKVNRADYDLIVMFRKKTDSEREAIFIANKRGRGRIDILRGDASQIESLQRKIVGLRKGGFIAIPKWKSRSGE